jgi:glycosyltransferase involved in cell wall biosynthesis
MRNLAAAMVNRGHRVLVVANGRPAFRLKRMQPAPVFSILIPYCWHQALLARIRAWALDCLNIAILSALCKLNKIDVIHCHLINVDTRYAFTLRKLLGIKVVVTLRGGEFHHWIRNKPWRRTYVRRVLESADAITALSHSQIQAARELAPSMPSNSPVVRNPADAAVLQQTASVTTEANAPKTPYIIFSGRLEDQKRVDLLIDAYHDLIKNDPAFSCDLLISGAGSLERELRARAEAGPGAARIRFTGTCEYTVSLALIRDAKMLVLPSQDAEGCPNVLLEAMALGTPVIVSDNPPLTELVQHGNNGEVFPRGNWVALQKCIRNVASDCLRARSYTDAARSWLQKEHDFAEIVAGYEQVYSHLVPQRCSPVLNLKRR